VREFRPLFGSYLLSTIGDELARLALTVLVYQRTQSTLLSAATFAVSYLPWVLGGPVLGVLADRFPRRTVLVASDVLRALLVACMALPGTPLPALLGLLVLVSFCAPPFEAARSALTADILTDDRYAVATSLTGIVLQLSQAVGFLAGGVLIAVFSPSTALLVNAATFAVSALWLRAGLTQRPAPVPDDEEEAASPLAAAVQGLRLVLRTPRLLSIVVLLWVGGVFLSAPEGIVTPWSVELTGSTAAVGLLLAANPVGAVLGGVLIGRFCPPSLRERLVPGLVATSFLGTAVAGALALLAPDGVARDAGVVVALFVSGVGSAWSIPLNVLFVQAVPPEYRGRAFAIAVAGLSAASGAGIFAGGALAEVVAPSVVVACAGVVGTVVAVAPLVALRRTRPPADAPVAGPSGA